MSDTELLDWLESQAHGRTGVTLDFSKFVEDGEVLERGYRVSYFHFLGPRCNSLRSAIREAIAASEKGGV